MINLSQTASKLLAKNGIVEEVVGQELFLFDQINQTVYCLNSGAALIWFLCDGTRDAESIAIELVTAYQLPQQQVLLEVQETTAQLQTLGLLEV